MKKTKITPQKIRIKLQSYDHKMLDDSAKRIVKKVNEVGALIDGPIALPSKKEIYTTLRSPFVNKKSREQYEICTHKRFLDVYDNDNKVVKVLMEMELPSVVQVELKA